MAWHIENDRPVYIQLVEHILKDIATGVYKPGEKFPAVRELASIAGVNPNTMQKALQELERQGILYSARTAGRFITEDSSLIKKSGEKQAMQLAQVYYVNMKQLGYSVEEMKAILDQCEEEGSLKA